MGHLSQGKSEKNRRGRGRRKRGRLREPVTEMDSKASARARLSVGRGTEANSRHVFLGDIYDRLGLRDGIKREISHNHLICISVCQKFLTNRDGITEKRKEIGVGKILDPPLEILNL